MVSRARLAAGWWDEQRGKNKKKTNERTNKKKEMSTHNPGTSPCFMREIVSLSTTAHQRAVQTPLQLRRKGEGEGSANGGVFGRDGLQQTNSFSFFFFSQVGYKKT